MPDVPLITGGCQCGAVRHVIHAAALEKIHYCHCRMCQRATGNLFAALAGAAKEGIEWTGSQPPTFHASSSVARRGFCPHCGTPLTFACDSASRVYVKIGSGSGRGRPGDSLRRRKPAAVVAHRRRPAARADRRGAVAAHDVRLPGRERLGAWAAEIR